MEIIINEMIDITMDNMIGKYCLRSVIIIWLMAKLHLQANNIYFMTLEENSGITAWSITD